MDWRGIKPAAVGKCEQIPDPLTLDFPFLLLPLLFTLVPTFLPFASWHSACNAACQGKSCKASHLWCPVDHAQLEWRHHAQSLICGEAYSHRMGQKHTWAVMKINTNIFLEAVRGCTATVLVSLLLSELDILSPHFLIICSAMTIFACCQNVNWPRTCPSTCALWPGGENWLYFHGQRVCVFSSAKSGLRRPPPHWACVCPRGPDPAFPVFLCLCRVFSTDLLAQLHSFILPPSSPSFSLLYLPDPSAETLV